MSVFNEDTRVKIPATIQFLRIGYDYQSLREADIDFNTKIFVNRFKPALEKINGREFTYDEIKMIINDIHAVIKNNDLGREFYNWLINPLDKVKLIDFDNVDANDFKVINQYTIIEYKKELSFEAGKKYTFTANSDLSTGPQVPTRSAAPDNLTLVSVEPM